MKQHQEVPRTFALTIIALIIVCLLITIFSQQANAQSLRKITSKEYHDKLQKQNSWENYQCNRIKQAKAFAKANRKQSKEAIRNEKINSRIRRIYATSSK